MNVTQFSTLALKNFEELAGQPGQCFYIPPYQRYVTWGQKNIDRFFDDIVSGIDRLTAPNNQEDAVTFLGSMIFYHDTKYSSIEPKVRTEVPTSVHNIIDGQQRLTVLMIVCALLHDYIHVAINKKGKRLDDGWFREKCEGGLKTLFRTIIDNNEIGEQPRYPRIIRAYVDQWSKKKNDVFYTSPLALFVSKYGDHVSDETTNGHYRHDLESIATDVSEKKKQHKNFDQLIKKIRLAIKSFCEGQLGGELPKMSDIVHNKHAMFALFNLEELDEDTLKIMEEKGEDTDYARIFRALVLASYVLRRICFISLVTVKEDDAFDIFESLNTTGVTLTALETFKPEAVRFETISLFSNSDSNKHFTSIESYIETIEKEEARAKIASSIVINFAIAEDGKKMSSHLSEQRAYLRRNYSSFGEVAESKRAFTHHLMSVSQVVQHFADEGGDALPTLSPYVSVISSLADEWKMAHFCLKYLRDAKHTIAWTVIARFHHSVMLAANEDERKERTEDLLRAIKAIAAFFALWRSSRPTTDGIDNRYRMLFNKKPDMDFSRRGGNKPSSKDLRCAFFNFLKEDGGNSERRIPTCEKFAEYGKEVPIYGASKETAKFLLLVAAHDAIPSKINPGLLEEGTPGVMNMISTEKWGSVECQTIEHLIPSSEAESFQANKETLDCLGNLTLLPQRDNSILSKRSWAERQMIYAIQSATTMVERRRCIDDATFLPEDSKRYFMDMEQSKYLPLTQAAASCENFDLSMVEQRGVNLAKLAWKTLAHDWLGFDLHS